MENEKEQECKDVLFDIAEVIDRAIRIGNLSFKDFESLKISNELKAIYKLNARILAEEDLQYLKDFDHDSPPFDEMVKRMKERLLIAGLTLEDIGTNEGQIIRLRKAYFEIVFGEKKDASPS